MIFSVPSDLFVEVLDYKKHNRAAFQCGIDSLDQYIRQYAGQDQKRFLAIPYVLCSPQSPKTILGYYTLSNLSIDIASLPIHLTKHIPYPSIPTTLIGRLAVAQSYQGQGYGKILLIDALQRAFHNAKMVASWAVIVDAINEDASVFYKKFGFVEFGINPKRLYMPISKILALFPV